MSNSLNSSNEQTQSASGLESKLFERLNDEPKTEHRTPILEALQR